MVHLNENVNGNAQSAYAFAEFAEVAFPDDGSCTVTSASSLPFTPSTVNTPLSPVSITVQYPSDPGLPVSDSVQGDDDNPKN